MTTTTEDALKTIIVSDKNQELIDDVEYDTLHGNMFAAMVEYQKAHPGKDLHGASGVPGDNGPVGPVGDIGYMGESGAPGLPGNNGLQGSPGVDAPLPELAIAVDVNIDSPTVTVTDKKITVTIPNWQLA